MDIAPKGYVLDCRIESGVHLYYEIFRDGSVEHIAEPVKGLPLVSAIYAPPGKPDDDTADDYRYNLPKKMSASQASSHVQRELGLFHKLRSIVVQSPGSVAYSVIEEKVPPKDKILPFSLPLEYLMTGDKLIPPCVTGVLFGESDLLILMAYPGNGRVFVQTSVSPDNLAEIITSFAAANSINVNIEAVPLYTGLEFINALTNIPSYPYDTDVMGLPLSSAIKGVLALSAMSLLAASGMYFYLYRQTQATDLTTRLLTRDSQSVQANMLARIRSNPSALTSALAVNYPLFVQHATELWEKGATVESSAIRDREHHVVILPLREKNSVVSNAQISQMIQKRNLPETCQFTGFTIARAMNAIKANYDCIPASSLLQVFGGDDEIK
ncbi:MAG TPA: hypothetical protein VFN66_03660 [Burkholderiales bacterium]|nr:hypothetical protein [Burkholderiales bacterium]